MLYYSTALYSISVSQTLLSLLCLLWMLLLLFLLLLSLEKILEEDAVALLLFRFLLIPHSMYVCVCVCV